MRSLTTSEKKKIRERRDVRCEPLGCRCPTDDGALGTFPFYIGGGAGTGNRWRPCAGDEARGIDGSLPRLSLHRHRLGIEWPAATKVLRAEAPLNPCAPKLLLLHLPTVQRRRNDKTTEAP